MNSTHTVIIIPGLGDDAHKLEFATKHFIKHNLTPHVYSVAWHKEPYDFHTKLTQLLSLIDNYKSNGSKVSLIGCSAGGSAVLNAFVERLNSIRRVINVCGRLRTGNQKGFRSYEARTKSSKAFAESVKLFESHENRLSVEDRKKVMTVRAMFGDELVPSDTTVLEGACNIQVPTIEHMLSIAASLTLFSKPLIDFIKSA